MATLVALLPLCMIMLCASNYKAAGQLTRERFPAMFVFGDSLIDSGNNNYLMSMARSNYKPYGMDYFDHPTGRFCNGRTVVDFEAQLQGLPLPPPYLSPTTKGKKILYGINFASAAGGILDKTGFHYGTRLSFDMQLQMFEKAINEDYDRLFEGNKEALSHYLAASLFSVNFGSNDYINNYLLPNYYLSSKLYTSEAFADMLISIYSQQIKKLYQLGARKIMLGNIGPLGCIPYQLERGSSEGECVEYINQMTLQFNKRLLVLATSLNSTLPGVDIFHMNTYAIVHDIVTNPSKYGFTVSNKACCGPGRYGGLLTCLPFGKTCEDRDKYVFWDAYHPTEAVHKLIQQICVSDEPNLCTSKQEIA